MLLPSFLGIGSVLNSDKRESKFLLGGGAQEMEILAMLDAGKWKILSNKNWTHLFNKGLCNLISSSVTPKLQYLWIQNMGLFLFQFYVIWLFLDIL